MMNISHHSNSDTWCREWWSFYFIVTVTPGVENDEHFTPWLWWQLVKEIAELIWHFMDHSEIMTGSGRMEIQITGQIWAPFWKFQDIYRKCLFINNNSNENNNNNNIRPPLPRNDFWAVLGIWFKKNTMLGFNYFYWFFKINLKSN